MAVRGRAGNVIAVIEVWNKRGTQKHALRKEKSAMSSPTRLRRAQSENAAFFKSRRRRQPSLSRSAQFGSPRSQFGAISPGGVGTGRPRSATTMSSPRERRRNGFRSGSVLEDDKEEEEEDLASLHEEDAAIRFTVDDETHLYAFCAHVAVFIESEADAKRKRVAAQEEAAILVANLAEAENKAKELEEKAAKERKERLAANEQIKQLQRYVYVGGTVPFVNEHHTPSLPPSLPLS